MRRGQTPITTPSFTGKCLKHVYTSNDVFSIEWMGGSESPLCVSVCQRLCARG